MGWQSYHHVVSAASPDEAFVRAKDQVDYMHVHQDGPSGTVLEQDGFEIVSLPALCDLTDEERANVRFGDAYARTQAFQIRLSADDRKRQHVRSNYRSWIADLGDGTMVVFGWAYAG